MSALVTVMVIIMSKTLYYVYVSVHAHVQMYIHIHPKCLFIYYYFCMYVIFLVDDMLPQVFLAVQIDELIIKCNKETVLLLRKFAVDSKVCM
jgi:hypothetical protein